MKPKPKKRAWLDEILQSVSDNLFPQHLGDQQVSTNSVDTDGDTPLHVMVWRGDNYALEQLVLAGADVNAIGDMGETLLYVAVRKKVSWQLTCC